MSRANAVDQELRTVAPKFAQLTNDVVFGELWRRSDLNPRDRSLATIAALAAMGDDDQLDFYLRHGVESSRRSPGRSASSGKLRRRRDAQCRGSRDSDW